jgi:hypothetical protein
VSTRSRFTIKVTEQDIRKAHRNNSYRCVAVQAIARTLTDATSISVDTQTVRFTLGGERFTFLTPPLLQGYVAAFDAGDRLHPFEFQLRDPHKVARYRRNEAALAKQKERDRVRRAPVKTADVKQESIAASPEGLAVAVDEVKQEGVAASLTAEEAAPAREAIAGTLVSARELYNEEPRAGYEPGVRRAPRRVFKSGRRAYGGRLLRINR